MDTNSEQDSSSSTGALNVAIPAPAPESTPNEDGSPVVAGPFQWPDATSGDSGALDANANKDGE